MRFNSCKTIFTAGVALNNTPHLLTIFELINMVRLQKMGYNTQVVLGDIDALLARHENRMCAKLVKQYRNFLLNIGYDVKRGIIRTQSEDLTVARNTFFISSYINEDDFCYVKEDMLDYYSGASLAFSMDYAAKLSYALMLSDFISPIMLGDYERTVVCSGLDESKYAILASKKSLEMHLQGEICGLFTEVVKGLNGYSKMSKSIPDSCIFLSANKERISEAILDEGEHDADSIQCQLAILFLADTIERAEAIYTSYSIEKEYKSIELELIDKINEICSIWRGSAE